MYSQTDARRRLGMRGREIVQKSFNGERYLREHEQMLWIGRAMKDMRRCSIGARELVPETFVENIPEKYRNSEIMGYRASVGTGMSQALTLSLEPPGSRLTPDKSTDGTGMTPGGSVDVASEATESVQTEFEKPANRLAWDKVQGQWAPPRRQELQI